METDVIHLGSCEKMDKVDDESIGMVITSPPYFNLKEYAQWESYDKYRQFIKNVMAECYRVMMPGSWIAWNIQEGIPFPPDMAKDIRKHDERYCEPLLAHAITDLIDAGFLYEKDIVWYKGKGTATQKLYGSYPSPDLILVSGITEHIVTARKPRNNVKRKILPSARERSKITKKEWADWAVDLWEIGPESKNKHPAPFPVEIPYRLIRLNSFVEDVILDPFMGSGSTAIAANRCGRYYVGYEIHKDYRDDAENRIVVRTGIFSEIGEVN